jgi:hypothetical protein
MIGKTSGLWHTYFKPSLNNVAILLCHIPYFLRFHRQNGVNAFHFYCSQTFVLDTCSNYSFDIVLHMCNQSAEVLKDVKI